MNIKELRIQTGMSQSQFANYFNIPPSTLKKWEQGQRQCPEYLVDLIEYKLKNEGLFLNEFEKVFLEAHKKATLHEIKMGMKYLEEYKAKHPREKHNK